MSIEIIQIKKVIEAALMSSDFPMNFKKIDELFYEEDEVNPELLREAIQLLMDDYVDRGIELVEVASGYRFQARQEVMPWLCRMSEEKPARYSRALLETLALIAYRQPITRAEIEEVRGVAVSSHIIKTLQEREWIRVIGHRDVPGRPALFATTKMFLDDLNLKSISNLPTLAEIKDLDQANGDVEKQLQLNIGDETEDQVVEENDESVSDEIINDNNTLPSESQEEDEDIELINMVDGDEIDEEAVDDIDDEEEDHSYQSLLTEVSEMDEGELLEDDDSISDDTVDLDAQSDKEDSLEPKFEAEDIA